MPKIAHFQLSPTFFNFHQDSKSASKEATLAKEQGYWLAIFAKNRLFSTFFNFFQLSSTIIKTQKVPQKKQFWQKSKAIGLPFLPKIAHFQLSPTFFNFHQDSKSASKEAILAKEQGYRLAIFAKNRLFSTFFNFFQLSSTFIKTQKVPQKKQFWQKSKAIGLPFLPKSPIFNSRQLFSTFFNFHQDSKSASKEAILAKK